MVISRSVLLRADPETMTSLDDKVPHVNVKNLVEIYEKPPKTPDKMNVPSDAEASSKTPVFQEKLDFTNTATPKITQPAKARRSDSGMMPIRFLSSE